MDRLEVAKEIFEASRNQIPGVADVYEKIADWHIEKMNKLRKDITDDLLSLVNELVEEMEV